MKNKSHWLRKVLLKDIFEVLKKNLGKIILMYFVITLLYIFSKSFSRSAMLIIISLLVVIFALYRSLPPEDAYDDYSKWKEWVKKVRGER